MSPDRFLDPITKKRLDTLEKRYETLAKRLTRMLAIFILATVAGLAAFGYNLNKAKNEQDKREAEAVARRNESCKGIEKENARNVIRLKRTYAYIELLNPEDFKKSSPNYALNRAVLEQLPEVEADGRTNDPSYCNEKGFGLPEPGPKPPVRKDFSYLLK